MNIVKDVELKDHVTEYDTVLIPANIYSTMNEGLPWEIRKKYPFVFEDNIATKYGDPNKLGTILDCKRDGMPTFTLCYIVKYPNARPDLRKDYLEYDSLEKCLELVNILYKGKRIALPILGCEPFDGNGEKEKVLKIIEEKLTNLDADVYDYKQKKKVQYWFKAYYDGKDILKEKGKEAYKEYLKEQKNNIYLK